MPVPDGANRGEEEPQAARRGAGEASGTATVPDGDMVTTGYDTYWVLPYFYSMFCIYIYKPWAMLCIPYLHSVSVPPL